MTDEASDTLSPEHRIARLERSVFWLKVGLGLLLTALILVFIPPIAAVAGLLLLTVIVVGGVIVFITAIICLLDRFFPGSGSKH